MNQVSPAGNFEKSVCGSKHTANIFVSLEGCSPGNLIRSVGRILKVVTRGLKSAKKHHFIHPVARTEEAFKTD